MLTLLEYIERERVDIDRDILKNIVDIINSKWVYLSEEIVVDMLGYKKSCDVMKGFHKKIIKSFEKDVDYKQVDKENKLVKLYLDSAVITIASPLSFLL